MNTSTVKRQNEELNIASLEKVYVNLSQESKKNSPEFDPDVQMTDEYEKELLNHYDKHINQLDEWETGLD